MNIVTGEGRQTAVIQGSPSCSGPVGWGMCDRHKTEIDQWVGGRNKVEVYNFSASVVDALMLTVQ